MCVFVPVAGTKLQHPLFPNKSIFVIHNDPSTLHLSLCFHKTPGKLSEEFKGEAGQTGKTKEVIRGNFQPHLLTSREGRQPGDWVQSFGHWLNQSSLCNEISVRTLNYGAQGDSWLGTIINIPIKWYTPNFTLIKAVFLFCPILVFHWLFLSCMLYNKNLSIVLLQSSVSHWSKLLNLRRLWEAPLPTKVRLCSHIEQKYEWPGTPRTHNWCLKWDNFVGLSSLTHEVCINSWQLMPELNWTGGHPVVVTELMLEWNMEMLSARWENGGLGKQGKGRIPFCTDSRIPCRGQLWLWLSRTLFKGC